MSKSVLIEVVINNSRCGCGAFSSVCAARETLKGGSNGVKEKGRDLKSKRKAAETC